MHTYEILTWPPKATWNVGNSIPPLPAYCVLQGVAVDDFAALMGFYQGPIPNKRASSGGVGGHGTTTAAGVNKSLVMRVERMAATAQLWSLTPWSRVRRYDQVHVKGITLRLRQVNGILNFSFLALKKKGSRSRTAHATGQDGFGSPISGGGGGAGNTQESNSRDSKTGWFGGGGRVAGVGDGFAGSSRSGGMLDLDGIEPDEEEEDSDDLRNFDCRQEQENSAIAPGAADELLRKDIDTQRRARLPPVSSRLGFGARRVSAPLATASSLGSATGFDQRSPDSGRSSAGEGVDVTMASPRWKASGAGTASTGHALASGGNLSSSRSLNRSSSGGLAGTRVRSMSTSGRMRSMARTENVGNLGAFKVLGEAFMRRFNAYCEQVSLLGDGGLCRRTTNDLQGVAFVSACTLPRNIEMHCSKSEHIWTEKSSHEGPEKHISCPQPP